MKKTMRILSIVLSVVMLISAIPTVAYSADEYTVINLSKADVTESTYCIQQALDEAKENATAENPYKIVVPAGTYTLTNALYVYSNTYLLLDGVTLNRSTSLKNNIIRTGNVPSNTKDAQAGYDAFVNITVDGGAKGAVLDAKSSETNTVVKMGHGRNITLKNITVQNIKNGHLVEVAGIDGLTVDGCSFKNQALDVDSTKTMYEAIQLDILEEKEHFSGFRSEDLPLKNVLVKNCNFENSPRGIGSHTAILNQPFTNITITGCTFNNMQSIAIQTLGWINTEISNNKITNSPRGIAIGNVLPTGKCVIKASELASLGATTNHTNNDKFVEQTKAQNIVIKNNNISCGTVTDKYNSGYVKAGITIAGNQLSGKAIPDGNYYVNGVTVSGNTITTTRYGIKVDDSRNIDCTKNTITYVEKKEGDSHSIYFGTDSRGCSATSNTIKGAKLHGIFVSASKAGSISSNTITNTGDNAIYVYNKSSAGAINSNTISGCTFGIRLSTSSTASSINSNKITSASTTAIYLYNGCSTASINSNTIKKSPTAIKLSTKSKATEIKSNNISGATTNIYVPSDCTAKIGTNIALATPKVTVANTASGVSVKWNKISGAKGYYVLRKVAGGSYSTIATIKSGSTVSYVDKKATNGKKYFYAVKAYDTSTVVSAYTDTPIVRVSTPKISSVTNKASKKLVVKWGKISAADGYEVKYVTGKTTKTVKVTKGSTVSTTITGLSKGKTYKVYVRAYKTVSGTKSYSNWSAAKSIKVTK